MTDPIINQVRSIEDFIREQVDICFKPNNLIRVLPIPISFDIRRIIITGCGDSLAAALAMKHLFEKSCDVMSVDVYDPITFNRYMLATDIGIGEPNSPLVIGISAGGETTRVAEAMIKANEMGAYSLMITNKENSTCAKNAKAVYVMNTPKIPNDFPGLRSYLASLIGLAALACRLGLVRGVLKPEEPDAWREEIIQYVTKYLADLKTTENNIQAVASEWKNFKAFDFIGDGQALATAMFGQEKIYECVGETAYYDDSEDWCHINYFIKNPERVGTVIHAYSFQNSFSRLKETIWSALQIGRPVIVITDKPEEIDKRAIIFKVPETKPGYEWLCSLIDFIPSSLLAGYLAKFGAKKYFNTYSPEADSWDPESIFMKPESLTMKNSKIAYRV